MRGVVGEGAGGREGGVSVRVCQIQRAGKTDRKDRGHRETTEDRQTTTKTETETKTETKTKTRRGHRDAICRFLRLGTLHMHIHIHIHIHLHIHVHMHIHAQIHMPLSSAGHSGAGVSDGN